MTAVRDIALVAATVISGLIAGLFAAFAYSVMPGLNQAAPASAVDAMRHINTAILNPVFGLLFGGGLIISLLAAGLSWGGQLQWWVLAGAACFVIGVAITMGQNVPLNNRLASGGNPADAPEAAAVWAEFTIDWVRWNLARTAAHLAGFGLLVAAVVER